MIITQKGQNLFGNNVAFLEEKISEYLNLEKNHVTHTSHYFFISIVKFSLSWLFQRFPSPFGGIAEIMFCSIKYLSLKEVWYFQVLGLILQCAIVHELTNIYYNWQYLIGLLVLSNLTCKSRIFSVCSLSCHWFSWIWSICKTRRKAISFPSIGSTVLFIQWPQWRCLIICVALRLISSVLT